MLCCSELCPAQGAHFHSLLILTSGDEVPVLIRVISLHLVAYVKLPPEKFAPKKQGEGGKDLPTEPKKLQLNSAEELYAEIRDKNFNAVGSVLSKKAKIISAAFEVRPVSNSGSDNSQSVFSRAATGSSSCSHAVSPHPEKNQVVFRSLSSLFPCPGMRSASLGLF